MSSALWRAWLATARKAPKAALVVDALSSRTMSAPMLTAAAESLAARLGKASGQIVAFGLPNTAKWLAHFLALQKAGAAALPLDPALSPEARAETARTLGASHLIENDELIPLGRGRRPPKGCACVKVTSGSSGAPKPLCCTAANLIADGSQIIRTMGIRARDKNLAVIPFGHSYGLGNLVMPLILQGNPVVCAAAFVPRQLPQWIIGHGATVFPGVPAIFRILAEQPDFDSLAPLRLAISAGAPLPPETAAAFLARYKLRIHNFYGSSETGGIAYDRTGRASLSGRSVGKPLHGASVRIGDDGRVVVRGRAVVGGRQKLADLAEWNPQGELVLLGRSGTVANIGGKKVHPGEIERALRAMPGVSDAWVGVFREGRGRDYLGAAAETNRSQSEIEKELARRVAGWKLPRRWVIAEALPRTPRGKLDTAGLKARLCGSG